MRIIISAALSIRSLIHCLNVNNFKIRKIRGVANFLQSNPSRSQTDVDLHAVTFAKKIPKMSEIIEDIKPIIRSLLLALGRRATELEFRREYYNVEGDSFNSILQQTQMSFIDFMRRIPDVCRVYNIGGELLIERVSTKESSHMDQLTIVKKKNKNAAPRFRLGFDYSGLVVRQHHGFLSMQIRRPQCHHEHVFGLFGFPAVRPNWQTGY